MAKGVKQADIARQAGISPSYLALIEKGRRPIGGALLGRLADALGVDRARLIEEEDRALIGRVVEAAGLHGLPRQLQEEAPDLVRRFPEWAELIAKMMRERDRDRERIAVLADRLTHDPALADAMHELLTTVASIRSTAAILAQTPELERTWLDRFHSNLDEESRRLASGAEAVVSYFDHEVANESHRTPLEQASEFLEHLAPGKAADPDARAQMLASLPPQAANLARVALERDDADRAALPDPDLALSPHMVAKAAGVPITLALRRFAACDPARGLVVCDASGALVRRRPVNGFSLPVIGAGCPLWPLYTALSRPLHPISDVLQTPDGALWQADAATEIVGQTDRGPVLEATMLVSRIPSASDFLAVGPGCRVCSRTGCPARREPSLLGGSGASPSGKDQADPATSPPAP